MKNNLHDDKESAMQASPAWKERPKYSRARESDMFNRIRQAMLAIMRHPLSKRPSDETEAFILTEYHKMITNTINFAEEELDD